MDNALLHEEDPIKLFTQWYAQATATHSITEPSAMSLATATLDGIPSVRIVLLKHFNADGFAFYTNLDSRKSAEIKKNPKAALCFYWMPLDKQIRIEGTIKPVTDAEADAYFQSRPFISRIGAWASQQSQPLDSRETLMERVKELEQQYSETNPPPRPENWSGWRVVPTKIEFWQQGVFRLHDRFAFTRKENSWDKQRLYP